MKNILKLSLCIFLILSLLSLTACGGGGGGKDSSPKTISQQTASRLSVKTVVKNITKIISFTPSASF